MPAFLFLLREEPHRSLYITDGVKREKRHIELDEVIKWAQDDKFWAQRGKAIQGYAGLEHALSMVLAALGDMGQEVAATIFYKIVSTGSRNAIIEKLLHKKFGTTYNPFWNDFLTALRGVDTKRNEIVHWLAAANAAILADNQLYVGVTLVPPAAAADHKAMAAAPMLYSDDLIAFEDKCVNFARLARMFAAVVRPPVPSPTENRPGTDPDALQAWREIFQQPFSYPLPADHLLFRKLPGSETQPQPWPG